MPSSDKLKKLRVEARAKPIRGTLDCLAIVDIMNDHWDLIQKAFGEIPVKEQQDLIDYFNEKIEDGQMGDLLFGDSVDQEEFNAKIMTFDDDQSCDFLDAVEEAEVLAIVKERD